MLTLAFDATADHCAVALISGDRAVADAAEKMARGQSERLFPMIDAVLKRGHVGYANLGCIGVCTGPGNFTGARMGVAAARGLALSLNIPAIGVDRFDIAAFGVMGRFVVALPARGGAAHLARYERGKRLEAATIDEDEIGAFIAGDMVKRVETPNLTSLGRIAALRAGQGDQPRPAPLYLRPPNAALPAARA